MAKLKLRGKDLIKLGYPEGKVIGLAINMMLKHYKRHKHSEVLQILTDVLEKPEEFEKDPVLGRIVEELREPEEIGFTSYDLATEKKAYKTYGEAGIEDGAKGQMDVAMSLPVTMAGALMPDAHQGYGLPIGGVLATQNAVIPYAVGVDIGCRMCLTIYDIAPSYLEKNRKKMKDFLKENTRFGRDVFKNPIDHEIMERSEFKEIPTVKLLKNRAFGQLGSSGGGNHFVEFGIVEIDDAQNEFEVPKGTYLGVLSHSGSRGMGANIARYYTQLAMDTCRLPREAKHLAWLDLDTEEGMEYWLAMNLAGDYASACHHQIHARMAKALGEQPLTMVENHHNFAWKEQLADGTEVIVHRKGATPAGKGVMGIIPGSMTASGFIVRGKGAAASINSASHGAGRQMSRTKAKQSITKKTLRQLLAKSQVDLIGGGLDEAPLAYKDIHKVMSHQTDLVDVVGTFLPKVVRMDKA